MSQIAFLLERFHSKPDITAVVFRGTSINYGQLARDVQKQIEWLELQGITPGTPIILYGDYSPLAVSMLLALIEQCCIIIPLTPSTYESLKESLNEVAPAFILNVTRDNAELKKIQSTHTPNLYQIVIDRKAPGLVILPLAAGR